MRKSILYRENQLELRQREENFAHNTIVELLLGTREHRHGELDTSGTGRVSEREAVKRINATYCVILTIPNSLVCASSVDFAAQTQSETEEERVEDRVGDSDGAGNDRSVGEFERSGKNDESRKNCKSG